MVFIFLAVKVLVIGLVKLQEIYLKSFLVGCFGLNSPLRQYFSLYWAVTQREDLLEAKWQMGNTFFGVQNIRF